MGYILGKAEGFGAEFHGHVTALTVAPVYRRLGVGNLYMRHLESISSLQRANFVDLFVRPSSPLNLGVGLEEAFVEVGEFFDVAAGGVLFVGLEV